jgi:iron complex transport system substrate-binding protein
MISQRMRPIAATLVFTSYLFATSANCAAAEKTITDASGRVVKFSDTSRILSIGGDITEILYALKADGKIIAVDSTSLFPAEAL